MLRHDIKKLQNSMNIYILCIKTNITWINMGVGEGGDRLTGCSFYLVFIRFFSLHGPTLLSDIHF